jgi:TonB family protein
MQKFSALLAAVAAAFCLGISAAAQNTTAPSSNPTPSPIASPTVTLLSKVDPVYPTEARAARTEGTVVLDAVISKSGGVASLKVVSGDQIFRASATEAVTLWQFKPYLVDGLPAKVETYITVRYRYSGSEEPRVQTVLQQDATVVPPGANPEVSPPRVIYQVEPAFTEADRRTRVKGSILVNCWVNEQGDPINVHVLRGTGTFLDEKAVTAVKQYKFKPAMENGEPLLVELNIEVNFNIF